MEPLRTLTIAGLRKDKGTFVGLMLLLFLAALALTLTTGLFFDLSEREETLLDQSGAGDALAYDVTSNLDDAAIGEIAALPCVEKVQTTDALAAPTSLENAQGAELREKTDSYSNIYEAWGTSIDVNVLSDDLASYRDIQEAPAKGEVYVRPAQKVLYGVGVGDYAVLDIGGQKKSLRVAGFFEDPQMGSPFMSTNRCIVSNETLEDLIAAAVEADASPAPAVNLMLLGETAYPITEINVFLTSEARAQGATGQDLTERIGEDTDWGATASVLFSRQSLAGYNLMAVQVITAVLAVFSLLMFVVALVLCLHTASSTIESGYADWGTLKGVGLSTKALRRSLVAQYALCALVGLLLGFAVGRALEPLCWPAFLQVTGILVDASSFPWAPIACCAALMASLLACIAVNALKIGRITPLEALRRGDGDVRFSPRGAGALSGRWLKTSLAWRSIVFEKGRYAGLAVCSLLLCAFITLCFGIGGAVAQDSSLYQAFGIWKSDLSVRIASDDVEIEEVRQTIEQAASIKREWKEGVIPLTLGGEPRVFVGLSDTSVLDEGSVVSGRMPKHAGEALVGLSLARSEGLSIGDKFSVTDSSGEDHTLIVCGLLSSALNGGNGVFLTYDGLEDFGGSELEAAGKSRQYQLADPSKAEDAATLLKERFGESVDTNPTGLFGSATNMILFVRDLLTAIGYAMSAFALALAFVAVMLVSRRMLVSERRDLGIYRAVGLSVASLRASFAIRFLVVSSAGALAGGLLVMAAGGWLAGSLFSLFGVGAFSLSLPLWEALGISAVFSLVFALAAYVFSKGIKEVSVRELVAE